MIALINIPNYEFNQDIVNKFQDYFERVKADIANGTLCGNYELETTEMFLASFKRMQVLPDNATNGDILLNMFDTATVYGIDKENDWITICMDNNFYQKFRYSWWNAQYKGV